MLRSKSFSKARLILQLGSLKRRKRNYRSPVVMSRIEFGTAKTLFIFFFFWTIPPTLTPSTFLNTHTHARTCTDTHTEAPHPRPNFHRPRFHLTSCLGDSDSGGRKWGEKREGLEWECLPEAWKNQENDVQKFIDLKMSSQREGRKEGAGGVGRERKSVQKK